MTAKWSMLQRYTRTYTHVFRGVFGLLLEYVLLVLAVFFGENDGEGGEMGGEDVAEEGGGEYRNWNADAAAALGDTLEGEDGEPGLVVPLTPEDMPPDEFPAEQPK